MSKFGFFVDLTKEQYAQLSLLQHESGEQAPTDGLVTSIIRSVLEDDIKEERKRAS